MPKDNATSWDLLSAWYQANARLPTNTAQYGPDIATEAELRLCGDVSGKRVLDLGCGGAQDAVAFARQGAKVIAVDHSAEQLAFGRRLAEGEGVKVELRQGDLADLAFVSTASIDLVFSSYAFGYVEDLGRVFRQVHRVLKPECPFVFSLPHPLSQMVDKAPNHPLVVMRSYWDRGPIDVEWNDVPITEYQHAPSAVFTGLQRANFRVDTFLEPEPLASPSHSMHWHDSHRLVPTTMVFRARKLGV